MFTDRNIELFLAGLVTRVALSFPLAYIHSIALFSNNRKIADCNWEQDPRGTVTRYDDLLIPVAAEQVVVEGIDANGQPLMISAPISSLH
jgi:hypothetical protein